MIYLFCYCSGSGEDHEVLTVLDPLNLTTDMGATSPTRPTTAKSPTKSIGGGKRRPRTASTSANTQGPTQVVHTGSRTIYTAGRPPWYDTHGELEKAFVIGM